MDRQSPLTFCRQQATLLAWTGRQHHHHHHHHADELWLHRLLPIMGLVVRFVVLLLSMREQQQDQ
jgi:hypothetical protein